MNHRVMQFFYCVIVCSDIAAILFLIAAYFLHW